MIIYDRGKVKAVGQQMANENGAPVWIGYNPLFGAYIIHEEPPPEHMNINHVWIIPPEGQEEPSQ